jgi:hypothetical protein
LMPPSSVIALMMEAAILLKRQSFNLFYFICVRVYGTTSQRLRSSGNTLWVVSLRVGNNLGFAVIRGIISLPLPDMNLKENS